MSNQNIPNLVNVPTRSVLDMELPPNFANPIITPSNDTITILGQTLQKKYVYIVGAILLLTVVYFVYKWYNKKDLNMDLDNYDEDEYRYQQEMLQNYQNMPPLNYQNAGMMPVNYQNSNQNMEMPQQMNQQMGPPQQFNTQNENLQVLNQNKQPEMPQQNYQTRSS